ncbi:hypothetical protein DFJ73DRAFT_785732 [Zopfochytrium polystomum]|nr:hypothetical protein DFJ73DRAFT_785732 [Zopfochytrium polystomum]
MSEDNTTKASIDVGNDSNGASATSHAEIPEAAVQDGGIAGAPDSAAEERASIVAADLAKDVIASTEGSASDGNPATAATSTDLPQSDEADPPGKGSDTVEPNENGGDPLVTKDYSTDSPTSVETKDAEILRLKDRVAELEAEVASLKKKIDDRNALDSLSQSTGGSKLSHATKARAHPRRAAGTGRDTNTTSSSEASPADPTTEPATAIAAAGIDGAAPSEGTTEDAAAVTPTKDPEAFRRKIGGVSAFGGGFNPFAGGGVPKPSMLRKSSAPKPASSASTPSSATEGAPPPVQLRPVPGRSSVGGSTDSVASVSSVVSSSSSSATGSGSKTNSVVVDSSSSKTNSVVIESKTNSVVLDHVLVETVDLEAAAANEASIREWVLSLVDDDGLKSGKPFADCLRDGVVLCKLATALRPAFPAKSKGGKFTFVHKENLGNFLKASEGMGVSKLYLFAYEDFGSDGNFAKVLAHLAELKDKNPAAK